MSDDLVKRLRSSEDMLVKTATLSAAVEFQNGRKAAFEEAAKVAESYSIERYWTDEERGAVSGRSLADPREIAAAIRALAEKG